VFVQDENEQTLLSPHFWHKHRMIRNVDLSGEERADEKQSCSAPDMPGRFTCPTNSWRKLELLDETQRERERERERERTLSFTI